MRRRPRDPEGRMPLREHLRELRQRLLKAGLAILVGAVIGWFLYQPVFDALVRPINELVKERAGADAKVVFSQVASPFNMQLKLAFYIGIVVSSPVWLYQLWAFVVPGLTKREKRYAMAFVGAAVPLFLAGIGLAWLVLPNAVRFLTEFTPQGAANYINADDYLTFVTRIMLAFGLAFIVPVLLVALNLTGVVSARALGRGWRIAVFTCFLFAAVASPTPDAGSMLALAFPIVGLYVLAWFVAWIHDRRTARRAAQDPLAGLSDDEASPLPEDGPGYDDAGYDDAGHDDAGHDDAGHVDAGHGDGVDAQAGDRPRSP
ncbi:MAG: twin-arginine translocase subunit TatC [Kineosporiaceae bacterium]